MANPFQDQLLKAGLVSKQQVQTLKKDQHKKKKQLGNKKDEAAEAARLEAQRVAAEKAQRDMELNKRKDEQARQKAISAEIDQLITTNRIERDESCDIAYNFEHNAKVKRIYLNAHMRQQVIKGQLGIARIEGCYELVPLAIAEKIQRRNEKRVVLFNDEQADIDENDPYADYQIPDDLIW